jgi:hypothetical protein
MALQLAPYTLSKPELSKLDEIYDEVKKVKRLRERVNGDYGDIASRNAITFKAPYEKSRLLDNPSSERDYHRIVLLYDYTIGDIFASRLKAAADEEEREREGAERQDGAGQSKSCKLIADRLEQLVDLGKHRMTGGNKPMSVEIEATIEQRERDNILKTPKTFEGKFFGYRESSITGMIRSFFEIRVHRGSKQVSFHSQYAPTGDRKFVAEGNGIYIGDTLYLYGHSREDSKEGIGASHGLRFLALKEVPGTSILAGPIITVAEEMPVASRIVLIPYALHDLAQVGIETTKEADIIDHMTDMRRYAWDTEKEILPPLLGAFREFGSGFDATLLKQLVRNGTFNVLRSEPLYSDTMAEIVRFEDQLKEAAGLRRRLAKETQIYEFYRDALRRGLSEPPVDIGITGKPPAPPLSPPLKGPAKDREEYFARIFSGLKSIPDVPYSYHPFVNFFEHTNHDDFASYVDISYFLNYRYALQDGGLKMIKTWLSISTPAYKNQKIFEYRHMHVHKYIFPKSKQVSSLGQEQRRSARGILIKVEDNYYLIGCSARRMGSGAYPETAQGLQIICIEREQFFGGKIGLMPVFMTNDNRLHPTVGRSALIPLGCRSKIGEQPAEKFDLGLFEPADLDAIVAADINTAFSGDKVPTNRSPATVAEFIRSVVDLGCLSPSELERLDKARLFDMARRPIRASWNR